MIDYIEGKILEKGNDYITVLTNGLGYHVSVDANTLASLGKEGDKVSLNIFTVIKQQQSEISVSLYGFKSSEDLHMFKLLLDVNGVGPKAAIGVLSVMTPDEFYDAVANNNAAAISKAKGISSKKAQEVIVVLKDKVKKNITEMSKGKDDSEPDNEVKNKTVIALCNWGCSAKDAKRVVNELYKEGDTFDVLLRAALKALT